MKGYPSAYICLAAMILAIIGQVFVELKLPLLEPIYVALSYGTFVCWIVFVIALGRWQRSDWLHRKLAKLNQDLTKTPKYEDPSSKK